MFNLFGSLFFGRPAVPVESDLLTTSTSDAATQTQTEPNLIMVSSNNPGDEEMQKHWVIVEKAKQAAAAACQEMATSTSQPTEEDNDVLLGSFFDRNYGTEEVKVTPTVPPKTDEWLITPLPCLTSITTSQRSLVDNDPLENLLIEHPSMSVFVAVENKSENVTRKEDSLTSAITLPVSAGQKKRKGMEQTSPQQHQPHQISPSSTLRRAKASKRNKIASAAQSTASNSTPVAATTTTTVSPSSNKENMAVKTILSSEFRSKANPASKLDSILLSKNQMKRNNKHMNKFNSINCIQRKFHKLQQPVCC